MVTYELFAVVQILPGIFLFYRGGRDDAAERQPHPKEGRWFGRLIHNSPIAVQLNELQPFN